MGRRGPRLEETEGRCIPLNEEQRLVRVLQIHLHFQLAHVHNARETRDLIEEASDLMEVSMELDLDRDFRIEIARNLRLRLERFELQPCVLAEGADIGQQNWKLLAIGQLAQCDRKLAVESPKLFLEGPQILRDRADLVQLALELELLFTEPFQLGPRRRIEHIGIEPKDNHDDP